MNISARILTVISQGNFAAGDAPSSGINLEKNHVWSNTIRLKHFARGTPVSFIDADGGKMPHLNGFSVIHIEEGQSSTFFGSHLDTCGQRACLFSAIPRSK